MCPQKSQFDLLHSPIFKNQNHTLHGCLSVLWCMLYLYLGFCDCLRHLLFCDAFVFRVSTASGSLAAPTSLFWQCQCFIPFLQFVWLKRQFVEAVWFGADGCLSLIDFEFPSFWNTTMMQLVMKNKHENTVYHVGVLNLRLSLYTQVLIKLLANLICNCDRHGWPNSNETNIWIRF